MEATNRINAQGIRQQLRVLFRMLGRTALGWIIVGIVAGSLTSLVELFISLELANLLVILGLSQQTLHLPFGLDQISSSAQALIIALVLLGVARAVMQFCIAHSAGFAYEVIQTRLRLIAYHESFCSSRAYTSLATLNARVGDHFPKTAQYCMGAAMFFPAVAQVVLLAAILMRQAFLPSVIGMVGVAVIAFLVYGINRSVRQISESLPAQAEAISHQMTRMTKNWFLLRALRTMEREYQRLVVDNVRFCVYAMRSNALNNGAYAIPQMLGVFVVVGLIFLELKTKTMSGAAFIAFLYLFLKLVQGLGLVARQFGTMTTFFPSFRVSFDYVRGLSISELDRATGPAGYVSAIGLRRWVAKLETDYHRKNETQPTASDDSPPSVEFRSVAFRYSESSPWVLKDLDFVIRPGEIWAIQGQSGSGKSTILALLLGLLAPSSGTILIDGQSPNDYFNRRNLRLGYVGAEPYLIEGTIRQNLQYGGRRIFSDSNLMSALRVAQLGQWIESVPDPLAYVINENGDGLSSGQKQRLVFARAILSEPRLLILDEVSANLDDRTESEIADVIKGFEGTCTTFIVTHRPGLIRKISNRIYLSAQISPEKEGAVLQ